MSSSLASAIPPLDRNQAALPALERGLFQVLSWLQDRETLGDLAERSGHDLPPASWALLEHLDARGSMRVSDVAACHGVRTPSVVPRLKALESTGLVERSTDADDARVSMICITAAGRRALQSIRAARQEALARVAAEMDPEALAATAAVLIAIAGRLSERRTGAGEGSGTDQEPIGRKS